MARPGGCTSIEIAAPTGQGWSSRAATQAHGLRRLTSQPSLRASSRQRRSSDRMVNIFAFMSHDLLPDAQAHPFFYFQEGAGTRDLKAVPHHARGPAGARPCACATRPTSCASVTFSSRAGVKAASEVPMHSSAIIDFANGTLATVIVTDDLNLGPAGLRDARRQGTISYDQHSS